MNSRKYPWAVIDGNQDPTTSNAPQSCHLTFAAAAAVADRENERDRNGHYYVTGWDARRWARLRPAPEHYPCDEWMRHRGVEP